MALDQDLARACADPGRVIQLYRTFLQAVVFAVGMLDNAGNPIPARFFVEDRWVCPVFTFEPDCDAFLANRADDEGLDAASVVLVTGSALVHRFVDSEVVVLIDSNQSGKWVIGPLILRAIADRTIFDLDEESFNGVFFTGLMTQPRATLKRVLRGVFREWTAVESAFMTAVFEPLSGHPPYPAVHIGGAGDLAGLEESLRSEFEMNAILERVAIYRLGSDAHSQSAMENSFPFYLKPDPEDEDPRALGRDELVDLIAASPAEPTLQTSLLKRYLYSESIAPSSGFARIVRERERQAHHTGSTHKEAKRVLLDVLRADGKFILYLRNFANEGVEALQIGAQTELVHVTWFTAMSRPADEVVARLSSLAKCPVVALRNPVDPQPRLSPIPQLEVPHEDWPRVMWSLVSMADRIYIAIDELTSGVAEELRAIQTLSCEERTHILLPDNAAAETQRHLRALQLESLGITPGVRRGPPLDGLRRKLTAFGRVHSIRETVKAAHLLEEQFRGKL